LIVYPDAMLTVPVALQGLKAVTRRLRQVLQGPGAVEIEQLTPCLTFDRRKPRDKEIIEKSFSILIAECFDHRILYNA
jgi:hypothetical protein